MRATTEQREALSDAIDGTRRAQENLWMLSDVMGDWTTESSDALRTLARGQAALELAYELLGDMEEHFTIE